MKIFFNTLVRYWKAILILQCDFGFLCYIFSVYHFFAINRKCSFETKKCVTKSENVHLRWSVYKESGIFWLMEPVTLSNSSSTHIISLRATLRHKQIECYLFTMSPRKPVISEVQTQLFQHRQSIYFVLILLEMCAYISVQSIFCIGAYASKILLNTWRRTKGNCYW